MIGITGSTTMRSNQYRFSRETLLRVFRDFLDRLQYDHGNDRNEMIAYHIDPLVGLTLTEVLRKMPRGPRGRWQDMIQDIRSELKELAK